MYTYFFHAWQGYIHGEEFNHNKWIVPGLGYDKCGSIKSFLLPTNNMYSLKAISMKSKRIADSVEALIGAYLSASGEQAAFHFINSLGMGVELHSEMQEERNIITKHEEIIDVRSLETMLGYVFNDRSLLVEALTHSSYSNAGPCYEVNL
jgi:endoribonuclease Dicer